MKKARWFLFKLFDKNNDVTERKDLTMRRLSSIGLGLVLLCSIGVSRAFCAQGEGAASTRGVVSGAAPDPAHETLTRDPFALSPAAFAEQDENEFDGGDGFEHKHKSKSKRCHNKGKSDDHNKHCRE